MGQKNSIKRNKENLLHFKDGKEKNSKNDKLVAKAE